LDLWIACDEEEVLEVKVRVVADAAQTVLEEREEMAQQFIQTIKIGV